MRLLVIFVLVLNGVTTALAQQADYVAPDLIGNGGSTEAAQSQAVTPISPPNPTPCRFGPITKRITLHDVFAIIRESPTRRAAWYFILARPEDEGAEPLSFGVDAPDDGLADGLVCPDESP